MKRKIMGISILWLTVLLLIQITSAQVSPTKGLHENTPRVFFLKGATIIPEPGKTISEGELIIRDGIIESIGKNVKIPQDALEIDLSGKIIYPGFIESYLIRKDNNSTDNHDKNKKNENLKQTITTHWNARIKPEYSVLHNYKPDPKDFETLHQLGFTAAQLVPESGIFRGKTALIHLDDWSQASIIDEDGPTQVLAFEYGGWGDKNYPNSLLGCIALIRQTFLDADWYQQAWKIYNRFPQHNEQPEVNISLEVLGNHIRKKGAFCFETKDELAALRAKNIAREFDFPLWLRGSGYEYRRLKDLADFNPFIILTLNFPKKPDVKTWEKALQYTNAQLRHWDQAPDNPKRMSDAGLRFSLTSAEIKDRLSFRTNLLQSVERGFSKDDALASLTIIPATELGIGDRLGTIERGKIANLTITDGDYFDKESVVQEVWIQGNRYRILYESDFDILGQWTLRLTIDTKIILATLKIEGKKTKAPWFSKKGQEKYKLKGKIIIDSTEIDIDEITYIKNTFSLVAKGDSLGLPGILRLSGSVKGKYMEGLGLTPGGKQIVWAAQWESPIEENDKKDKDEQPPTPSKLLPLYPEGAFGWESLPTQPPIVLVKNATIWTSGPRGILEDSDLLIRKGKVWRIGKNLEISGKIKDAVIIDARGKHITPGLIDAHSHTAAASINEGTQSVTAEVRIEDVIDSDDIAIYRELAGGLTIANILHGSANAIGGQNAVIKLRWGYSPDELLFEQAPKGIKFALGENVKQSNWGDDFTTRYPQTRMGVEQIIRDAFVSAKDYTIRRNGKGTFQTATKIPPRRDLELDALVEVLDGKRMVHCHSYRQDEILMLTRIADDFGFTIGVFQHVLEGYKIAERIAEHGAGASTFTDWWAYKIEVIDAIPYNGSLMHDVGVVTSFNSDSDELARRLNTEAAKGVKYGGLSKEEALKFVTLNPAIQLKIDKWVGSLEEGKDADFVIWSGNPLSTYAVCEQTWIDGINYFNLIRDRKMRKKIKRERNELIQKILSSKDNSKGETMTPSGHEYELSHPFNCLKGVIR